MTKRLAAFAICFSLAVVVAASVRTETCKSFVFEPDKAPKTCRAIVRAEEKRLEREGQKRRME